MNARHSVDSSLIYSRIVTRSKDRCPDLSLSYREEEAWKSRFAGANWTRWWDRSGDRERVGKSARGPKSPATVIEIVITITILSAREKAVGCFFEGARPTHAFYVPSFVRSFANKRPKIGIVYGIDYWIRIYKRIYIGKNIKYKKYD